MKSENGAPGVAERELQRVETLYSVSLRDYFSTFAAYATATSILLAGLGFVAGKVESAFLVAFLSLIGIFLCFQWHISTTSMRDQYTHFYMRMVYLESELGHDVMLRWHDAANAARGRRPLGSADKRLNDHRYLTWSFRQIGRPWAMRGASLPVIYSSVFLAVGLALGAFKGFPWSGWVASLAALAWLVLGNILIFLEVRHARRRGKTSTVWNQNLEDRITPRSTGRKPRKRGSLVLTAVAGYVGGTMAGVALRANQRGGSMPVGCVAFGSIYIIIAYLFVVHYALPRITPPPGGLFGLFIAIAGILGWLLAFVPTWSAARRNKTVRKDEKIDEG